MTRSAKLLKTKPVRQEEVQYRGHGYIVNYMPTDLMQQAGFNGYAYRGKVHVSDDLTGKVKRFVIQHELYHLRDRYSWFGYFGQELRANIVCGVRDPLGFAATVMRSVRHRRTGRYIKSLFRKDW